MKATRECRWWIVLLCLIVFGSAWLIAELVLEQVPHIEDEVAYLFQARVFAEGRSYVASPQHPDCFSIPFVLDSGGRRFGKYPPGWPLWLSIGLRLGQIWWVNAAFAALTVALTYRLGSEIYGQRIGLLAAALATASPFLLLQSGSLMPHISCLAFVTGFLWCFRQACLRSDMPGRSWSTCAWATTAGALLGGTFITRPFTALAVGLPAAAFLIWKLWKRHDWRLPLCIAAGLIPLALLFPYFNMNWTGSPLVSGYELYLPFDRIGFGPGHGPPGDEHTVWKGLANIESSVWSLATTLHGWKNLSLVFVVFLFLSRSARSWGWFLGATALSLILSYGLYWASRAGMPYGPRYLFEATSALCILSAAGISEAYQRVCNLRKSLRLVFVSALSVLIVSATFIYLPKLLRDYHGLYGITSPPQSDFGKLRLA